MKRLTGIATGCFGVFVMALASLTFVNAQELSPPSGDVVLTVSGAIGVRNAGDRAEFDLAMLEAMPKHEIRTTTPWTNGVATFEGFALKDLLAAVGATGTELSAIALNDYATTIPVSDADLGAVIAYKVNGNHISVREKGPLWVIYPFDDQPELKIEITYGRSIWQLTAIEVR